MQFYSVPFSSKEEEKLIFNLSTKETFILGSSIILGLLASGFLALLLQTYMFFCLPVAIPFVLIGAVFALKKINKSGCEMTVGEYMLYKYKFNNRIRHYLRLEKKDGANIKWNF